MFLNSHLFWQHIKNSNPILSESLCSNFVDALVDKPKSKEVQEILGLGVSLKSYEPPTPFYHPITFRGSWWQYVFQREAPWTPECQEGVPRKLSKEVQDHIKIKPKSKIPDSYACLCRLRVCFAFSVLVQSEELSEAFLIPICFSSVNVKIRSLCFANGKFGIYIRIVFK